MSIAAQSIEILVYKEFTNVRSADRGAAAFESPGIIAPVEVVEPHDCSYLLGKKFGSLNTDHADRNLSMMLANTSPP
jgi:hypothetical protein